MFEMNLVVLSASSYAVSIDTNFVLSEVLFCQYIPHSC